MVNWGRVKRRLGLYLTAQLCFLVGAVGIAVEPVVGITIVLLGVVLGTKLLIDILSPTPEDDAGVRTA